MFRKMKCLNFLIVSLLILSNITFAEDSVKLNANQPAPFEGYLITHQKANELRLNTIERNNYKLLNESLQKSLEMQKQINDLNSEKVNMLTEQNDKLAITLEESRNTSDFTKALWFILGIAATGAAIYGASKLQK